MNFEFPLLYGEIYKFIKKSYTGGSINVYKPTHNPSIEVNPNLFNDNKIFLRSTDVNSLYPFAIKHFLMPSGQSIYFKGDILSLQSSTNNIKDENNKPFGIFEVDIESPSDMKIPLLQYKIKTWVMGKINLIFLY